MDWTVGWIAVVLAAAVVFVFFRLLGGPPVRDIKPDSDTVDKINDSQRRCGLDPKKHWKYGE